MKAECIQAVTQALGRSITVSESRDLEARIRDAMRRLAADDPNQWGTMSAADRLAAAAKDAGDQLVYEAQLKKVRIAQTIVAHDRIQNYLDDQVSRRADKTKLDAMERIMVPKNDGKNNTLSIESQSRGIVAYGMGKLFGAWEAVHPRFLGIFRNQAAEESLILELNGHPTGDAKMAKAAQSFQDLAEELRKRFNAAGGSIGRLENWGMPHKWSSRLFIKGGTDAVAGDFMRWIDRSKYYHEDGRAFNDAEMVDFLKTAWLTIATDGANKQVRVDVPGGSIKANRHGAHRSIHFKDGPSALEAFRKYSDQNLFQALAGHVRSMARDISVIETLGPNADLQVKYQLDKAYREATVADPSSEGKYSSKVEQIANQYNYVSGNNPPPASQLLANISQDIRNVLSSALLGSSPITSIADVGTVYLTARINKLPLHKLFLNQVRALNVADRGEQRLAMRAGLMVDTMISEMNRFAAENSGPRLSSKISNTAIRLSGLPAWTEANRRAFSVTMMDTIGHLTRNFKTLKDLDVDDHKLLLSKGITEQDWGIWTKSTPEVWRGSDTVLTAEAIMRTPGFTELSKQQAATKLLGLVLEEQDIAVIQPGARERASMAAGTRSGTFKGELVRSFFLFKSFPWAMMMRHWERGLKMYDNAPGKAGYISSLIAIQTILGAVAMEVNDIVSGRDPRNLSPGGDNWKRNWVAAFLKGGAVGLYGDFLFNESTANYRSLIGTVAGPVAGLVESTDDLTRGNIIQMLQGKETRAGAEAIRFMKGITPGANLWYAKAALNHLIFNELQEYVSPGYLAHQKARSQRLYNTSYWWGPGESFSEARAPDLSNIVSDN